MSNLHDHVRAWRILGDSLANRAQQMGDPTGLLACMADAHHDAADRLLGELAAESLAMAEAHRCTIDHRAITVPKCPACGAPREGK